MRQPLSSASSVANTMFMTPRSVAEADRQQQLAKWETSETNRVPSVRRPVKESKVQFTETDVFLSACLSGDIEEVQMLLDNGADIDTRTVDGLTALHQAVIDGKPEMVQFLCEHGANLDAQDNEGWTPLHAAACCGNVELVEYLCMVGADIAITNSDKELAVDLAEEDDCRNALEDEHQRRNVDPDQSRNREMMLMRRDAEEWLREGVYGDRPHPKTLASALHVAAAKGYVDVMRIQLRAGADVSCRDRDGWTPLHAAAHWGEKEAASLLVMNGASFDELTNNGETVMDVADKDMVEYLETLQQQSRLSSNSSVNVLMQSNTALKRAGSVSSVLRLSTEEKSKKTKLDEQDENKDLQESVYSSTFIIDEKTPSPSVECRLPFPTASINNATREQLSETPSENGDRSSSSSKSASPADSNEDRSASIASNQSNSTSSSTSNTSNHSVANKSPSESARSSVESNPAVIADRWSTSASLSKPNQTAPASVSKDMTNVPLTRNVIIERVSAKVPLLSGGAQRVTSPVNERRSVEKVAATRLQDVGERRRLSPDLVAQSAQSLSSSSSSASPSPAPAKSPSPASKSPSPEDSTTTESSILERVEEPSVPTSVSGGLHTKSERQPSGYLAERLAAGAVVERPQSVVQPQKSQEISSQSKHIAYPESLSSSSRTPSTESASNSNAVAPSSSSQVHPSAVISPTVPSRPGWQQDGKRVFPTSASTPQAQTTPITTTASAIPHQLQKESSLSTISSPPQSPLLKKSSTVQRTGSQKHSTPLPWMPLLRNSSSSAGGPQGPAPAGPINPAFSHFQSAVRQQSLSGRPSPVPQLALASAAKSPLTVQNNPPKSVSSSSSSGGSLSAAPSNSVGPNRTAVRQNLGSSSGQSKFGSTSTTAPSFVDRERVTNTTSYLPTRSSFVAPTPPQEPNMPKESEAERRSKAKRQRDSRRSTQGVTREQLRAASASVLFRDGKENDHRNRWSSSRERERELSKTPSQESLKSGDSQASTVNSTEVVDEQHDKKPTSTTVTASSYPTKDMANLRRRSQISRSTRRGTGPISFEEVQSALDAISTPPKDQSQQQVTEGVSSLNAPSTSYTNTSTTAASTLASAKNQPSSIPSSASTANSNAITRVMITERDKSWQPSQSAVSHANTVTPLSQQPHGVTPPVPPRSSLSSASKQPSDLVTVTSRDGIPTSAKTDSIDYKELYEKERQETERLRKMLEELQEKAASAVTAAAGANGMSRVLNRTVTGGGVTGTSRLVSPVGAIAMLAKSTSTTSIDETERRTYERRIADLEYELKQLEHLRTDNQKLKEENGALIRVISKLSK